MISRGCSFWRNLSKLWIMRNLQLSGSLLHFLNYSYWEVKVRGRTSGVSAAAEELYASCEVSAVVSFDRRQLA